MKKQNAICFVVTLLIFTITILLPTTIGVACAKTETVIEQGEGVGFADSSVFKNENIMRAVALYSTEAVLTSTIPPNLIFNVKDLSPEEKIAKLISFFMAAGD